VRAGDAKAKDQLTMMMKEGGGANTSITAAGSVVGVGIFGSEMPICEDLR
jgi:hypothetical protein